MSKGTVKFYNEFRGFGFIKEENSPKEYFVHSSGLKETISYVKSRLSFYKSHLYNI